MTEPAPTSSASPSVAEKRCEDTVEEEEIAIKKRRLESCDRDDPENKLEARLGGILCCAVCLDLPRSAVYQVSLSVSLFSLNFCLSLPLYLSRVEMICHFISLMWLSVSSLVLSFSFILLSISLAV